MLVTFGHLVKMNDRENSITNIGQQHPSPMDHRLFRVPLSLKVYFRFYQIYFKPNTSVKSNSIVILNGPCWWSSSKYFIQFLPKQKYISEMGSRSSQLRWSHNKWRSYRWSSFAWSFLFIFMISIEYLHESKNDRISRFKWISRFYDFESQIAPIDLCNKVKVLFQ